jgi:hypothetical protein
MSITINSEKKAQIEQQTAQLKANLKKIGINLGYKVLDDGLILSIDLESLINAIFSKYPNIYRQYEIAQDRYLFIEVR